MSIMPLEVILKGFRIDEYLRDDFKERLKKIFDEYNIRVSQITFILIPKKEETKKEAMKEAIEEIKKDEKEKSIKIYISPPVLNQLVFRHRGEKDYKEKMLIVSSSREELMSKFLKSHKEVLKLER